MKTMGTWRRRAWLSLAPAVVLMAAIGCTSQQDTKANAAAKTTATPVAANTTDKGHDHSGWWCDEHGVPEEICGQCSAKFAKECKAKGDWCKEHNRPESQCFICHPELKEKFAAQYRAKYGKEPPPVEEEKKDGDKK